MARIPEASSNGRTADFGSADEGSNPSASNKPRNANRRAELKSLARPPKVLLVGLGTVPRALLADAGQELARVFAMGAALAPAQARPQYAYNESRGQYHAAAILRRLSHLRGGDVPVLGVADVDLFVPDAPFVFVEDDRGANAAVISLARLQYAADGSEIAPERLRRRVLAEAVHGVGHLLGLADCADSRCAMYLSHRASDADRKGPGICAQCRAALGLP